VTGAGLYIQKRSGMIVALVAASAVANLVLNLALVPRLGIEGAAIATLLSYALLAGLSLHVGRGALRIPLPVASLAKFVAIGAVMYAVVNGIVLGGQVLTLVAKVVTGVTIYAGLLLAVDGEARSLARSFGSRALARVAGAGRPDSAGGGPP
jgi:O-antigen/teichoic acid export membrane protein